MGVSLGTWIVGLVLLIVVGMILRKMITDKKKGKGTSCGGDCSHCKGCH